MALHIQRQNKETAAKHSQSDQQNTPGMNTTQHICCSVAAAWFIHYPHVCNSCLFLCSSSILFSSTRNYTALQQVKTTQTWVKNNLKDH